MLLISADVRHGVGDLQDLYLLQSPLDILLCYPSPLAHVDQSVGLILVLPDKLHQSLGPPGEISLVAQVREGLFWSSNFLFDETKFVAERDEELAVPLALVEGKYEDAAEIVLCFLYLREVAGQVILVILDFTENIEKENAHILVKILMVEEELRQKGQVLAVNGIFITIDLEYSYFVLLVPIDLVARRVVKRTCLGMPPQLCLQGEETQTEIAYVETVQIVVVNGVGTEVPL